MSTTEFKKYQFGDTEFVVPARYIELSERGMGAQGAVWWVIYTYKSCVYQANKTKGGCGGGGRFCVN